MSETVAYWFSPTPCDVTSSRLSLDFNLRAADLFFRELVVPGLGRIWFVRQLSWPLAALALHEELASCGSNAPKPTAICHGIEALACKLEFKANSAPDSRSKRILGSRAFGRNDESNVWLFHDLHQASHYVRNTHRQAATRALRVDGGLGFAQGSRFDLLELEPVGRELASRFLGQRVGQGRGTSLRDWLLKWLKGDLKIPLDWPTLVKALSPEHPTKEECAQVQSRLLETSSPASKKRQNLKDAFGSADDMPDIEKVVIDCLRKNGHKQQADEIAAARAFGAVLDRAREAVASLTHAVEPARGGKEIKSLARDSDIKTAINALKSATGKYETKAKTAGVQEPTSGCGSFATQLTAADDIQAIRLIVGRAGEVLGLADGCVVRGPLFRVVKPTDEASDLEEEAVSIEPDRTGRTFRIANFHSLLRDIDQGVSR